MVHKFQIMTFNDMICAKGFSYGTYIAFSILCLARCFVSQEICRSNIHCYECNSNDVPQCGDPYNKTDSYALVPLMKCFGCCVKLIRNKHTAYEFVMRTCSSNPKIEIEHNLIDLVCLREWKSSGRLCFCEHDRCNDANFVKFEYNLGLLFAFIVLTYIVTNRIKNV